MPKVMRVAPTPLYNTYTDVYNFITTLYDIFKNMKSLDLTPAIQEQMMESFEMENGEEMQSPTSSDSEGDKHDSLHGTNTL